MISQIAQPESLLNKRLPRSFPPTETNPVFRPIKDVKDILIPLADQPAYKAIEDVLLSLRRYYVSFVQDIIQQASNEKTWLLQEPALLAVPDVGYFRGSNCVINVKYFFLSKVFS